MVQTAEFYGERIHCQIAALSAGVDLRGQRLARMRTDRRGLPMARLSGRDVWRPSDGWRGVAYGLRTRLRISNTHAGGIGARAAAGHRRDQPAIRHTEEVAALTTAGEREGSPS